MYSDCISNDIPTQMKILNMVIHKSNALLKSSLKMERCQLQKAAHHSTKAAHHSTKAAHHSTKCYIINDVKKF